MIQNSNALKIAIFAMVFLAILNTLFVTLKFNTYFDISYIFVASATIYFATILYEEKGGVIREFANKI